MSGAWSDGTGGPLRASRSISASTWRGGHRPGRQQQVDAHPEVLVEHARSVVPPGVAARLVVAGAVGIGQATVDERPDGGALGLADVRAAVRGARVPHVDIGRGDVEVAADEEAVAAARGALVVQPPTQPLEPGELAGVERRPDDAAVGRVDR